MSLKSIFIVALAVPIIMVIAVIILIAGKPKPVDKTPELAMAQSVVAKLPIPNSQKSFDRMETGMMHFKTRCSSCHGFEGKGTRRAPDLAGGKLKSFDEIMSVITVGRKEKGMPAWGEKLRSEDIQSLAAYVIFLQGK